MALSAHSDNVTSPTSSGHEPGVYQDYDDCMKQITRHKDAKFQRFATLKDAEAFVRDGPDAESRFTNKSNKFYAVRLGRKPGIYTDWPSAQKQTNGFTTARHKSFHTRAAAQAFLDGDDDPEDGSSAKAATSSKSKKKHSTREIDENVEPGSGPMPPISEDGFDARITLNAEEGRLQYKDEKQQRATKMQPDGHTKGSMLKIYTDGSSLGNGRDKSYAGVGVYFGPLDSRNVSEPLKGPRQTNQRAELTALQRAIEIAPRDRDVTIYSDSKYAISCVTVWFKNWRANGWRAASGKSVENRDIVEAVLAEIETRERLKSKTLFEWVKGHANEPGNVAADGLAQSAAQAASRSNNSGGGTVVAAAAKSGGVEDTRDEAGAANEDK